MKDTGFSVLFLGAAGTFSKMLVLSSVGVNRIWPRTIKVANLLPALIVAILLA